MKHKFINSISNELNVSVLIMSHNLNSIEVSTISLRSKFLLSLQHCTLYDIHMLDFMIIQNSQNKRKPKSLFYYVNAMLEEYINTNSI